MSCCNLCQNLIKKVGDHCEKCTHPPSPLICDETSTYVPKKENPALRPALDNSNSSYHTVMKNVADTIQCVVTSSDLHLKKNTELLENRARDVAHWRGEIQALILKLREEVAELDGVRKRTERSLTALQTCESINAECMERRLSRPGYDLIPDEVDASLAQEERLCKDIRDLLSHYLKEIESQLQTNITCKVQLEFDWSDKNESYRLESVNVGLKKKGPILFHPGATRFQANQSTPEHWCHYTKELAKQGTTVLERSAALRGRTQDALDQAASDLRNQANAVQLSFNYNIACTQRALQEAEAELTNIMNKISSAETLKGKLNHIMREVDLNLKVSQTRQNNRSQRPRAENTRDCIQESLISEVAELGEDAVCLKQQVQSAATTVQVLYNSRALLEEAIAMKRKSLYIDKDRCLTRRALFPDTTTMTGF